MPKFHKNLKEITQESQMCRFNPIPALFPHSLMQSGVILTKLGALAWSWWVWDPSGVPSVASRSWRDSFPLLSSDRSHLEYWVQFGAPQYKRHKMKGKTTEMMKGLGPLL